MHLEIVESLDTQSCLDAVHRFIARRGKPKTVISYNGSNFVGAANDLKIAFKELNHSEMQRNLAQNGIQWTFNTPCNSTFRWRMGVSREIEQKRDFQYFGQGINERGKSLDGYLHSRTTAQ